jgi:perosamine synthetase
MIPVNEPVLSKNAAKYTLDCVKSGWISSAGAYIARFEEAFARFLGVKYAITTTNGTAALHLAIASLGIGKNDEVIMPDLTIISCPLSVMYTGAAPVFVDVDPVTFTIDPARIEEKITKRTRAIMVVHLYGHPADMDPIMRIAKKHKLAVIEDAAEAHGALYKSKPVGTIGTVATFSFYANKIVTTGEGGMVVTNNSRIAGRARFLKDLAHSPRRRFWHEKIGFNYRMTNVSAAIGLAQLESVRQYIAKKKWMAREYAKALRRIPYLTLPPHQTWANSVYWMYALTLTKDAPVSKNEVRTYLKTHGIDTRDFFYPLHMQPILRRYVAKNDRFPVSDFASRHGFYVPSGLAITKKQIRSVASALRDILSTLA